MVARRTDTNPAVQSTSAAVAGELFEMWRHLVTRALDAVIAIPTRFSPAEQTEAAAAHWLQRRSIVWLGHSALAIGAVGGFALAEPGLARSLAVWAGFQSVLWAVVRWLLMAYVAPDRRKQRPWLLGAVSLGLVAYAFALTPELRAVAWAASAASTWLALVLLGDDRRAAARTVGIAWGAQALVVVASWIARGSVLAFLLSRG